jgi:type IV secretion system coupling TraD/TrwB family protein
VNPFGADGPWRISRRVVVTAACLLPWGALGLDYLFRWTPLQQQYLAAYLWSAVVPGQSDYGFVTVVSPRGRTAALDADVVHVAEPSGAGGHYVLSPAARRAGGDRVRVEWHHVTVDNATVHDWLREGIYRNAGVWDLVKLPLAASGLLPALVWLGLVYPPRMTWRALRAALAPREPTLVTRAAFNRRTGADGVGLMTLDPLSLGERCLGRDPEPRLVRVSRADERGHFLLMGDPGTGTSSIVRQLLRQIRTRGETAIVYDRWQAFTVEFYDPARGDGLLNPLDQRMPYWTPGDELTHGAEAPSLAASLIPETPGRERARRARVRAGNPGPPPALPALAAGAHAVPAASRRDPPACRRNRVRERAQRPGARPARERLRRVHPSRACARASTARGRGRRPMEHRHLGPNRRGLAFRASSPRGRSSGPAARQLLARHAALAARVSPGARSSAGVDRPRRAREPSPGSHTSRR